MIESGSHTPGVSIADFHMPPRAALRFELPEQALRRHVTSYIVMDAEVADPSGAADWMLPGWAQIWIVFAPDPLQMHIRNRDSPTLPTASLLGVTSRAIPVVAHGGISIVINISPAGWARLIDRPADQFSNLLVPLRDVMRGPLVDALVAVLQASDRGLEVKAVLDRFFSVHLGEAHPDEPLVSAITAGITNSDIGDVGTLARVLAIDPRLLRRITKRHFGFPPATLLLRTRFMKALLPLIEQGPRADFGAVPRGYHDVSHFLRDANRFLGMTPRRFVAIQKPFSDTVLRARRAVLEADRLARGSRGHAA